MSDAAITAILTQVGTIIEKEIRQEFQLVFGVGKEVKKLKSEFESIKAVLVDAQMRQVKEESVKVWLEKIRDVSYDTEDVLSEWIDAMQLQDHSVSPPPTTKVHSFMKLPCLGFDKYTIRRNIAMKIKKINERLAEIAIERKRYEFNVTIGNEPIDRLQTASLEDISRVHGREAEKATLITKLRTPSNNHDGIPNVVSVVGLGGIGKTTLAQEAYNEVVGLRGNHKNMLAQESYNQVIENFELGIWVCVLEQFNDVRVAKAILEGIEGREPCLSQLSMVVRRIHDGLRGKKFLLVLDDVWTEDFRNWEQIWNSLTTGAPGSTILVTSRSEIVANVMRSDHVLRLGKLSDDDSWLLFKKIAFHKRNEEECTRLGGIGRQISDKCNGLPLTVKTVASLMVSKKGENEWSEVCASEFWEMEEAEKILPPLMLSYYHLHPFVQRCFLFCAVFPKNHEIYAEDLIKHWMALGYLDSDKNIAMEELGQEYFEHLVMRCFFEKKKVDGKQSVSVKMHDMVHDLALYLTKNECLVLEARNDLNLSIKSCHKRVRHLTLIRSKDSPFPKVPNMERLRTYWVQSFYDSPPPMSCQQHEKIGSEFFTQLAQVKALDLSRNRIAEVGKEIGNLSQLKMLNMSHNSFQELPASVCDLYNLQTLNLSYCSRLQRLPQGIGKLVKLRHLVIDRTDKLKTLPKGIGNMELLQTLSKFVIGRRKTMLSGELTCGLEDLNKLNNLRGCLKIEGLGYVTNTNEAKQAELHKKSHLTKIIMDFGSPECLLAKQEETIEALKVHENVQCMDILSYKGSKLPNWITGLRNLQTLLLKDCTNCVDLPPLGKLPCLETLRIDGMNQVTVIGANFLGTSAEDATAFPVLKQLNVSNMEMLEEWNDVGNDAMPELRCLKVLQCAKLKRLPVVLVRKTRMAKLRVRGCPLVGEAYYRETGEELGKIPHIQKITVS